MLAAYPEQEETVVLHKGAGESVACARVTSALNVCGVSWCTETQQQAQLKIPLWLSKVKALPITGGGWEGGLEEVGGASPEGNSLKHAHSNFTR